MHPKHSSLVNLYDEWVGQDKFEDAYGGIEGRDKRFKSHWRKHLNVNHYSKTKRVVQGIRALARRENVPTTQACIALQPKYVDCKYSVANFVRWLQSNGLCAKMKTRGRHTKTLNSPLH